MNRDNSIDCLAAIVTIRMILLHACLWSHTKDVFFYAPVRYLIMFSMGFFFYKSGMFYKKKSPKEVLVKGWSKFFLPFIAYMILGEIARWIRLYVQEVDTNIVHYVIFPFFSIVGRGGPSGNLPLWFLLALPFVQLTVAFSDKYCIKRWILFLVALVMSFVGTIVNKHNIIFPPLIWEVSIGLVFFLSGDYLKDKQYEKKVFYISLVIYLVAVVFAPTTFEYRKGSINKGDWFIFVVSSIAGIITYINLFRLPVLRDMKISYISRNSMQYYCMHWVLFNIVCTICGYQILENGSPFGITFSQIPNYKMLCSLCISCIVCLPIYELLVKHLKKKYDNVFVRYL